VTERNHRLRLVLAPLVLLAATWTATAPAFAVTWTGKVVQPTQQLAGLRRDLQAFSKPTRGAATLGLVRSRRPITGGRTVLPVLDERKSGDGTRWLRVRLPGRPNGRTGWIRRQATLTSTTRWHVVVETSRRRMTVYRDGRPVRTVKAVVGKRSTPTPIGEFFVEEDVQLRASADGAPFAIALSARSNVLQEFNGGPGQIALHGRAGIGGVLGTAVSHGCVRLDDGTLRWLVLRVGPGVPVTITN
jgi:lipoprotein-anchoring transpeptidase ErfK/SrfK